VRWSCVTFGPLVTLVDADTFTTAAAVLGATQPTLSRTIAQLEELRPPATELSAVLSAAATSFPTSALPRMGTRLVYLCPEHAVHSIVDPFEGTLTVHIDCSSNTTPASRGGP
jgi:hypothetical protein